MALLLLQVHTRILASLFAGIELSEPAACIYDHECTIITQSNEILFSLGQV